MEVTTYKHRHLKYYEIDHIGYTHYRVRSIDWSENPVEIISSLRETKTVDKWWVEETTSTVTSWNSDEVYGRYQTSGICTGCGHVRSSHNEGGKLFGTSCFYKNGHDVYCDCQAFVLHAQCKLDKPIGDESCDSPDCLVHGWAVGFPREMP